MISSTSWVSKGFPQQEPVMDYEVNDNEMNKINEMMKLSGISQDEDLEESEKPSKDDYKYADDEDLKKFNMDDYDDEPQTSAAQLFGSREFDKSFLKGANTLMKTVKLLLNCQKSAVLVTTKVTNMMKNLKTCLVMTMMKKMI